MRLKSWKVLPLLLVILLVLCVVVPAQGGLYYKPAEGVWQYKGDWCSFEVPDGFTVTSEQNTLVILQKVVPSVPPYETAAQILVFRSGYASDPGTNIRLLLESYTDIFVDELQDAGYVGEHCTSYKIDMVDGLHGRTYYRIRTYDSPYSETFGYIWRENNNDIVLMSLAWSGSQVPYKDVNYLTKPYRTFKYYGKLSP